jgi:hypothetical protein
MDPPDARRWTKGKSSTSRYDSELSVKQSSRPDAPKVLIVGTLVGTRKPDDAFSFASGLSVSPTFHDFGVLLCRYSNETFRKVSSAKWREFQSFLANGGIAFVTNVEPTIRRFGEWLVGQPLHLQDQQGRGMRWTRGTRFYDVLKDTQCERWSCLVPRDREQSVNVLGRNLAGDAVAFEVRVGSGSIVFLPWFGLEVRERALRSLIAKGQELLLVSHLSKATPAWAASIPLESERMLRAQRESIDSRIVRLANAKAVLVSEGKPLSKECSTILGEILGSAGFEVTWKEESGGHDIEAISSSLSIVIEVRASTGMIEVSAARQLLDHIGQFPAKTPRLKGLLIGNPYRTLPLPDRGALAAFSDPCLSLLRRSTHCALTTIELLTNYDLYMQGKLDVPQWVEAIWATHGRFRAPLPPWAASPV